MEVESFITVSNETIGKVRLDPTMIRGAGGEYDPRLVIPLKVELYPQPLEHQISIIRLSASLNTSEHIDQNNQFASKIHIDTIYNWPIRSVDKGTTESRSELHFSLTHTQLKALENMRHELGRNLYVYLEPIIVWNKFTGNSMGMRGEDTVGAGGWSANVGMFSDLAFFWLPRIGTLRLNLAEMKWVEQIFPGMGYDNLRLIEVKLPTSNVFVPVEAIDYFKQAKESYDRGDHVGCLEKCRYALDEVEKNLHPRPQGHALGNAITSMLSWQSTPELTAQAQFLDASWLGLYILANAAHHTPSRKSLLPSDAHIVLLSLAAMMEYIAQLE